MIPDPERLSKMKLMKSAKINGRVGVRVILMLHHFFLIKKVIYFSRLANILGKMEIALTVVRKKVFTIVTINLSNMLMNLFILTKMR